MLFPFAFFSLRCSRVPRNAAANSHAVGKLLLAMIACSLWAPAAFSQGIRETIFVCDSSDDRVMMFEDVDASGAFEPTVDGEIRVYYDDSSEGPDLSTPSHMALAPSGELYLLDGGALDAVLILDDLNGDGDANDAGEVREFYSGDLGAVTLRTPNTLVFGPDGALYLADDSVSSKRIIRLEDLNGNGSAIDEGEASVVYDGSALSTELSEDPESIAFDASGRMYVGDSARQAIFRMTDRDGDGTFLGEQEVALFFQSSAELPLSDVDCLSVVDDVVFVCDEDTGTILRLEDVDGSGSVEGGEASVFLDATAPESVRDTNDFTVLRGGRFLVLDGAADTMFLVRDSNGDGDALDEGEVRRLILDDGVTLATPSGIAVVSPSVPTSASFIRGDTTGDQLVDLSDAVLMLDYLFGGAEISGCLDSADSNDDTNIDITDAIYVLMFLFADGPAPPPPFPSAGPDPTDDAINCDPAS